MKRLNIRHYCATLCAMVCLMAFTAPSKNVLIIGDSISIGYFPHVKKALEGVAEVAHNPGNAQHTGNGLRRLDSWLGDAQYDVITFNWGLWDLCYRHPESTEQGKRDKVNGNITFTVDQYQANMEKLVRRLEKTGAKLVFVTTTVVPPNEVGRFEGDEVKYNKAATAVMDKHGVEVLDLRTASVGIHQHYKKGEGDVHYTKTGYKKLAGPVAEKIREMVE